MPNICLDFTSTANASCMLIWMRLLNVTTLSTSYPLTCRTLVRIDGAVKGQSCTTAKYRKWPPQSPASHAPTSPMREADPGWCHFGTHEGNDSLGGWSNCCTCDNTSNTHGDLRIMSQVKSRETSMRPLL